MLNKDDLVEWLERRADEVAVLEVLREDLVDTSIQEANDDIARTVAYAKKVETELRATEADRDKWRTARVDVGNRFDLYRADAERQIAELRLHVDAAKGRELEARAQLIEAVALAGSRS